LTVHFRFCKGATLSINTGKGVYLLANHPSALKRARQNEIRRMRNKAVKTRVKKAVKNVRLAVEQGSGETAANQLNLAKSIIDNAAKRGVIHKKTAARKTSRLSKRVNTTNA
jgi:small subunit ribosomal protein S20